MSHDTSASSPPSPAPRPGKREIEKLVRLAKSRDPKALQCLRNLINEVPAVGRVLTDRVGDMAALARDALVEYATGGDSMLSAERERSALGSCTPRGPTPPYPPFARGGVKEETPASEALSRSAERESSPACKGGVRGGRTARQDRARAFQASGALMGRNSAELAVPNPTALERILAEWVALCWFDVNAFDGWFVAHADRQALRDGANQRFLDACRVRAAIRKLGLPAIQFNVAHRQVNVAAGPMGARGESE